MTTKDTIIQLPTDWTLPVSGIVYWHIPDARCGEWQQHRAVVLSRHDHAVGQLDLHHDVERIELDDGRTIYFRSKAYLRKEAMQLFDTNKMLRHIRENNARFMEGECLPDITDHLPEVVIHNWAGLFEWNCRDIWSFTEGRPGDVCIEGCYTSPAEMMQHG